MSRQAERLGAEERDGVYEMLLPGLLRGALPSDAPVAMIVAGQPGAGASLVAFRLHQELVRTVGTASHLSPERLLAWHPLWRALEESQGAPRATSFWPDINHWLDRAIRHARQHRLNMVVEDKLQDPRSISKVATSLREDGYAVQAVLVCASADESRLMLMFCYERWRRGGQKPQFVTKREHDDALANLHSVAALLEEQCAVDGLRVVDRQGRQIYDNRRVDGRWLHAPWALAALQSQRGRTMSHEELVKYALRWETVVQRLVHDLTVPREVASQALQWRNEVVARCEADPAPAQMLQWAREAEAFRVMSRFLFEKEFPHLAHAVRLLDAAVIEAGKHEPAECARIVAAARENICERIKSGEMARIAAREISRSGDVAGHR
jgi:hypothetical protein